MQIKNPLLDDLAKTVTGAMGGIGTLKSEADTMIKNHIENALQQCDVVSRQEYLVLKKMINTLTEENIALKKRLDILEQKIEQK